jgi:16S rRNA (adenine1518-N6/adenine1519-N6)-dimethyltransferase
MNVHRSAFVPPPKVMSAVVHITPSNQPVGVGPKGLERLTEFAFRQRRKMLRSSVKDVPGAIDALERLGIDSSRRAETVSVPEWIAVARELSPRS